MRIVTWNVNGLRARTDAILEVWQALQPDVLCLQETKCTVEQVPERLRELPGSVQRYNAGPPGYAGTAILCREAALPTAPVFSALDFDTEGRSVVMALGRRTLVNLYMPNGGKDYASKLMFYDRLTDWVAGQRAGGRALWVCGDMNVAHTDRDIHPLHRAKADIGVRPAERERVDALLAQGLVDVYRQAHPDADDHFTWWPYWRAEREKNRGWRIDYHLIDPAFGPVSGLHIHTPKTGSDHAPLIAEAGW